MWAPMAEADSNRAKTTDCAFGRDEIPDECPSILDSHSWSSVVVIAVEEQTRGSTMK